MEHCIPSAVAVAQCANYQGWPVAPYDMYM